MSIEKNMEVIATSLASIAKSLEELKAGQIKATDAIIKTVNAPTDSKTVNVPAAVEPVVLQPAVVPAPVVAAPAPIPTPVAPAPAPAPVTPTAVAPSGSAPFTDAKGLMAYVMSKYQALGPVKGGEIQGVLTALGHKNINELKPEQYGEFHARVEAL